MSTSAPVTDVTVFKTCFFVADLSPELGLLSRTAFDNHELGG